MNFAEIRDLFPVMKNYIYFDQANKCAVPVFIEEKASEYIRKAVLTGGDKEEWYSAVEETRNSLAQMLNVSPDEIAFTKNTSEGLNIAATCLPLKEGDTVLLNKSEHPNNVFCWLNLEKRGINVKFLPDHDGEILLEDIIRMSDESTRVIAMASVTYTPGNRNDIKGIAEYCRKKGIYTVVDAVQSIGTLDMDVSDLDIDILCASGYKAMLCPHGLGFMYINKNLIDKINPLYVARAGMHMAASIENEEVDYELNSMPSARKFEIGNYNYMGVTLLNESVRFLTGVGMDKIEKRLMTLVDILVTGLQKMGYEVAGPVEKHKRSAITCFKADDVHELYAFLKENKVVATVRRGMIRLALGVYNNEDDINQLLGLLKSYQDSINGGVL